MVDIDRRIVIMDSDFYESIDNESNFNATKYEDIITVKISIVGDTNTGKSVIFNRFVNNIILPLNTSTIGVDFGCFSLIKNKKLYKIQLWDTAGHEKFKTITKNYYRNISHVLLVFDLGNKKSFENIGDWITDIKISGEKDIIIILVGNKSDSTRVVSFDDITKIMVSNSCISNYIEMSALDSEDNSLNLIKDLIVIDVEKILESNKSLTNKGSIKQVKIRPGIYYKKYDEDVSIPIQSNCCTIS